jgi:hypothetical protein
VTSQAPLVLGATDPSTYAGELAWAPTQKTYGGFMGYYLVRVTGFYIEEGGVAAAGAGALAKRVGVDVKSFNRLGGMIIDSGTTALILPTPVYVAVVKHLMEAHPFVSQQFLMVRLPCQSPCACMPADPTRPARRAYSWRHLRTVYFVADGDVHHGGAGQAAAGPNLRAVGRRGRDPALQ